MQITTADAEAITRHLTTRPCPFCGSRAILKSHREAERRSRRFTVECSNPECPVDAEARGSEMEEALAKWATREFSGLDPAQFKAADIREWPRAGMVACDFCLHREADWVLWTHQRPSDASRVLEGGLAICVECAGSKTQGEKETPCTKTTLA